ncbi:MAG: hypothetical protein WCG23_06810 [bacterium]
MKSQTFFEYDFAKDQDGKKLELDSIFENEDAKKFELFLEKNKLTKVFNITQTSIQAQNYVGVIKYKNYQFEILPKLLGKNEEDRDTILKNLFYMLSYTKQLDIKDNDVAKLSKTENPFLEVLIGIFASSLLDSLLRFIPKNYVLQEDNLKYLKGKLNFTENTKKNIINKACFYCEYDEFSEDNLLNQLFYYVCLMLSQLTKTDENKRTLKQILNIYSEISFVQITKEKIRNLKLFRSQKSFEKSFNLAKMFIENSSVEISSKKFKTISLMWDMNLLFEEFIYQYLRKNQHKVPEISKIRYQNNEKLVKKSVNLLEETNHKRSFKNTYTDILIELYDGRLIILDTKWKLNDGNKNEFKNADIYQLLAYKEIHNRLNENQQIYPVLAYPLTKEDFAWQHEVDEGKEVLLTCFDLRTNLKENSEIIIKRINEIISWIK